MDLQDLLGWMESMVSVDHWDLRERRASLVIKADLVPGDLQV
jgi:hypothetical protein